MVLQHPSSAAYSFEGPHETRRGQAPEADGHRVCARAASQSAINSSHDLPARDRCTRRHGLSCGWTGARHAVWSRRRALCRRSPSPHADGLADLLARLARSPRRELPVAIERPSGLIVDTLIERAPGRADPPQCRQGLPPALPAAGGKSDPGDAYLLADLLRTDGHRFRRSALLRRDQGAARLVRGRDDLVAERVALANQLRACSRASGPAPPRSSPTSTRRSRWPSCGATRPRQRQRLGEKRMAAFLAQHRYCGRRSHRAARPPARRAEGRAGEAEADANGELVRALVAVSPPSSPRSQLGAPASSTPSPTCPTARSSCPSRAPAGLRRPDPRRARRRPRALPDRRPARRRGRRRPVTQASGKSRGVVFRWACNHRLRAAITCFADNSRAQLALGRRHLQARARPRLRPSARDPHPRPRLAPRPLAAWTDREPYDPNRHTGRSTRLNPRGVDTGCLSSAPSRRAPRSARRR